MYRVIASVCAIFLCACGSITTKTPPSGSFQAKPTVYRRGEDRFGSRIAMPGGQRAVEGKTCAAESQFPFGTQFQIPELDPLGFGSLEVQDRGRDVERRRASRGQLPVIDIYVASRKKYNWLQEHLPPILNVTPL